MALDDTPYESYWEILWKHFKRHHFGHFAIYVVLLFVLVGIYAPFLASSKPFCVYYDGTWYFPLFRYLFDRGFFTKNIDIFFNLLIFMLPASLGMLFVWRGNKRLLWTGLGILCGLQLIFFLYIIASPVKDPASNPKLNKEKEIALKDHPLPDWNFELSYMNPYKKLNLLLREQHWKEQQESYKPYAKQYEDYAKSHGLKTSMPTLWNFEQENEARDAEFQRKAMQRDKPGSSDYEYAKAKLKYIEDRRRWFDENVPKLQFEAMPPISHFHWEDDAGGDQTLNQFLPWWDLTRTNGKDLLSALIFGVRISLVVGITSVAIALIIGIPVGAYAGFYGGTFDIIVSRLLEIWESMPTFFMLLFVVAVIQSKSIFIVIAVIGLFGWTSFSRYIRGEFFKQRNLPYVEACKALGFSERFTMFSHILPNAIPPVLTLLPFAIMGAITSEAGLSFLGLGEENSASWGVLMDEGRRVFPGQSYLLWPPAILLTILLVAIALVGDALRDALDPKMRR